MAYRVITAVDAELQLLAFSRPDGELANQLFASLYDELWREENKIDLSLLDGEGEDALPVFAAYNERVVAWFVENESIEEVLVFHYALLSRFRYPWVS